MLKSIFNFPFGSCSEFKTSRWTDIVCMTQNDKKEHLLLKFKFVYLQYNLLLKVLAKRGHSISIQVYLRIMYICMYNPFHFRKFCIIRKKITIFLSYFVNIFTFFHRQFCFCFTWKSPRFLLCIAFKVFSLLLLLAGGWWLMQLLDVDDKPLL